MSGFERSAPVPGSQGPRRSQMVRYNNAPPPMSPWRQEVLQAQKQLQGLVKDDKRPRSRSRSNRHSKAFSEKAPEPPATLPPTLARAGGKAAMLPPEKAPLLRKAKEHGEGWFAAIAHAAASWESVGPGKKKSDPSARKAQAPLQEVSRERGRERSFREKDKEKERDRDRDRDHDRESDEESETDMRDSRGRTEEREKLEKVEKAKEQDEGQKKQQDQDRQRLEKQRLEEIQARENKLAEERRVAEEQRKKREEMEKRRRQNLAGAFAVGDADDDDDDDAHRQADRMRQVERKRPESLEVVPTGDVSSASAAPRSTSVTSQLSSEDLSERLRFEPGLTPAEAFMRLQERKRKGRRAEFGGPPRGCSPWRDGRRGSSRSRR